MDIGTIAFAACAGGFAVLVLTSAVLVVLVKNLFRAALSLGLVLLGVAGLFILLEAEFLAFVQVLVYVGAILTLVVFAVMLTAREQAQSAAAPSSRAQLPAAMASIALFGILTFVGQSLVMPSADPGPVSLTRLGEELITELVLPFEVISLVFVAALVGAILLAMSPKPPMPSASK